MFNTVQQLLVRHAPAFFRVPVTAMPFPVQKKVTQFVLAHVFRDALADGDFTFLEQKILKLAVPDIGFACHITAHDAQLTVLPAQGLPDVSFSAGLNDLILIAARREDPDSLFFQRRLKIEGDTELGLEVKNLIDSLDLDVLPRVVNLVLGDLATFIQQHASPVQSGAPQSSSTDQPDNLVA